MRARTIDPMKVAMLALVVLTGCASTSIAPPDDSRPAPTHAQSGEIAAREQRCIEQSSLSEAYRIAAAAGRTDYCADLAIEAAQQERVAEVARCRIEGAHALAALAPEEQAEYALEVRDERDRAALWRSSSLRGRLERRGSGVAAA